MWQGSPEADGTLLRELELEYLQAHPTARARNTHESNRKDIMEVGNSNSTYSYSDLIVPIDVGSATSGLYSASPHLRVDQVGTSVGVEDSVFENHASPAGSPTDFFRFDASGSGFTSPLGRPEEPLARIWYDADGFLPAASGYYDTWGQGNILKTFAYKGTAGSSGTYVAALDLLNPDELAREAGIGPSSTAARRDIDITLPTNPPPDPNPLTADIDVEVSTDVWKKTDQILHATTTNAAPGVEYRWRFTSGGSFTAWTDDQMYDFEGHGLSGMQAVTLEVRNPDGEVAATTEYFDVVDQRIDLTGPTYITVKQSYTYYSNVREDWYQRLPPNDWQGVWWAVDVDSMERVWAAGEYEAHLRQEGYGRLPSAFRRGRLDIEICTGCGPGGGAQSVALGSVGTDGLTVLPVSTFGAGPIIVIGERVEPLYDLTGILSAGSPFRDRAWLGTAAEEEIALPEGGRVGWRVSGGEQEGVTLEVELREFASAPLFGFAWDPDVGERAADDRSGYDADLRMVYAYDDAGAVGLVVERGTERVPLGIQQYGARRQAPVGEGALRDAIGTHVRLMDVSDDVQFVLTALADQSMGSYRVRIIEAPTVQALKELMRAGGGGG